MNRINNNTMADLIISSLKKITFRLLWLCGWGLLLWIPLRWWPGDWLWPVRWLNYVMPWLLVGLLPALLVAGMARRFRLAWLLAVPTLFITLTFVPLFLPRPQVVLADQAPFKVMSYNVWHANQDLDQDLERVVAVIERQNPDILLLQELRLSFGLILIGRLEKSDPNGKLYIAYERDMAQGVISRYPLTPLAGRRGGRIQKVRVEMPSGPVTVWNVHLSQPTAWSRHQRQANRLVKDIAAFDQGPLIVGGDFNTTDQSEAYRHIAGHLENAHWRAGWGFGFSYPNQNPRLDNRILFPVPLVRIDHLFYNDHLFVHQARTLSAGGGSDHLPIVATVSLIR